MPPIVLLSDFGLSDPYVGQMKGCLADLCPGTAIIDLSHGVRPFAVAQAAFFLQCSWLHFPAGSIFVCVVDPGVGSDRSILALECGGSLFLAPDNGLLSLVMTQCGSSSIRVVDDRHLPATASTTFHGRDIFAPLAAKLVQGLAFADLGPEAPRDKLVHPPWAEPEYENSLLTASVLHVDRFGNCILNLPIATWQPVIAHWPLVRLRARTVHNLVLATSYVWLSSQEVGLVAGSQGFLELACNMSSAAKQLALDIGDQVLFFPGPRVEE